MRGSLFLALFSLVIWSVPGVSARTGGKVVRMPEPVVSQNSQTMALLEARHNIYTGTGGKEIAIVDDKALLPEGDLEAYADAGTGQIYVYIVRKGDTLPSVAKMFGVSPNTIVWANNLRGGRIKEGEELVILPITGVRHKVRSGDTIQSVAKRYKADVGEILSYNGLTASEKLAVGEEIIVPDGEISAAAAPAIRPSQTGGAAVHAGYYMRPISGGRKSQGLHGHNAIDLAAPIGTSIVASASGKVIIARTGWNGGYGNYVVISHSNGTQTLYSHLHSIGVSAGESVSQGQYIGSVGNTGKSTGPHLHFEIRGARNPF